VLIMRRAGIIAVAAALTMVAVLLLGRQAPRNSDSAQVPHASWDQPRAEKPVPPRQAPQTPAAPQAREPAPSEVQGRREGGFVRQRHDYPTDTPERLGPEIGLYLFDLERVVDVVARGDQEGAEIARVRGEPLTAREREQGRRALQAFFDAATPIVDDVLAGEKTRAQGLAELRALRHELNRELARALALGAKGLTELFPHLAEAT
jgi:hypothetical protein